MDISIRLHKLSIEMREFAEVIRRTNNSYHPELIHACALFSRYLQHELDELGRKLRFHQPSSEIKQASQHMAHLCQLITPPDPGALPSPRWQHQLMAYCEQINALKQLAA